MQRYADCLEAALRRRGHQVIVATAKPRFARLTGHASLGKYLGYIDTFLLFPPRLKKMIRDVDIVHVLDHTNSMFLKYAPNKPSLITCHDMLAVRSALGEFRENPTGFSGRLYQRWILSGLRRARAVACISEQTRQELLRLTGRGGEGVYVIDNPLTGDYHPGAFLPQDLLTRIGLGPREPYILHVGANSFYKNRIGVVRIFARLAAMPEFAGVRLVMAGKPWPPDLRAVVEQEKLGARVLEAAEVSDQELNALYGNARLLLFPSLAEGFGWPIVEAQACGCPVVTSNRSPMTEVAGGAAILIDPSDPDSAARLIRENLDRLPALREAGLRNVRRFDTETIVDRFLALYAQLIREFHPAG
jgi:glycosyltransferase involved in cell wall biosynthesis